MIARRLRRWLRVAPRWELPFTLAVVILAVAIPTAGLLFFMNQSVNGAGPQFLVQLQSARQAALDQALGRVQQRLGQRLAVPTMAAESTPTQRFEQMMRQSQADGGLILNEGGEILYPLLSQPLDHKVRTRTETRADRMLDAALHEATRTGQPMTLDVHLKLAEDMSKASLQSVRASAGRPLWPLVLLAAVQNLPPTDLRRGDLLEALRPVVEKDTLGMPASQRIFLAHALLEMGESIEWPFLAVTAFSLQMAQSYALPTSNGVLLPVAGHPDFLAIRAPEATSVIYLQREPLFSQLTEVANEALAKEGMTARLGVTGHWETDLPLATRPLGPQLAGWEIATFGVSAPEAIAERMVRLKRIYLFVAVVGCLGIGTLAAWAIRRFAQRARDNQTKQDFLSVVSHELKTPLTSIRMFVDSLADGGLEDPARARTYLDFIRRENERLSRLVVNFLTFSRLDSGRMNFDFHIVHPEDIGEAVSAAMGSRMDPTCQFSYTAEAGLPLVRADESALTTALVNLLDNGLKYSGEQKRLGLEITQTTGQVAFAVTDNGMGMSDDTIARLGEKYFRNHSARNEGQRGFGLGLHIVRSVVEAHEGKLEISSTLAVGSRLVILLPAQPEPDL